MKSYIKIELSMLRTPEMEMLLEKEGMRGIGIFFSLLINLRCAPNGRANLRNLGVQAVRLHTKAATLRRIICDYGVFCVSDDGWYGSVYLDKTLGIKKGCEGSSAAANLQQPDNQDVPIYTDNTDNSDKTENTDDTDCARPDETRAASGKKFSSEHDTTSDRDKGKEQPPEGNERFLHIVNHMFADKNYMAELRRTSQLSVDVNKRLRGFCRQWFVLYCREKDKAPQTETDARAYLKSLLTKRRNTWALFRSYLNVQYSLGANPVSWLTAESVGGLQSLERCSHSTHWLPLKTWLGK